MLGTLTWEIIITIDVIYMPKYYWKERQGSDNLFHLQSSELCPLLPLSPAPKCKHCTLTLVVWNKGKLWPKGYWPKEPEQWTGKEKDSKSSALNGSKSRNPSTHAKS